MKNTPEQKKKVKFFNKHYKDMQSQYYSSIKRNRDKILSLKNWDDIETFMREVDSNIELYNNMDNNLFHKVAALNRIFYNKPSPSNQNKTTIWRYIQLLYSIVKNENKALISAQSNAGSSSTMESMISNLMNDSNSPFKSLVEDISKQVEEAARGKQIDQNKIISDLMSGNIGGSGGIDFKSIIENTSQKLQTKVNSGEVDINKLKETGEQLQKFVNIPDFKNE